MNGCPGSFQMKLWLQNVLPGQTLPIVDNPIREDEEAVESTDI